MKGAARPARCLEDWGGAWLGWVARHWACDVAWRVLLGLTGSVGSLVTLPTGPGRGTARCLG